jgi:hypothetical protein
MDVKYPNYDGMCSKMRRYLVVLIILLLAIQGTVYGTSPSAQEIYNQVYSLGPGENIKTAYEMYGNPQEKCYIPPILLWEITQNSFITVYHSSSSIIESCYYVEEFDQIENARKRYQELVEGFSEIIGSPYGEPDRMCIWLVKSHIFAVVYDDDVNGPSNNVFVYFMPKSKYESLENI